METLKSFITGAGGFMGSHLVDFLTEQGHEVSGIYFGPVNLVDEIKNRKNLIKCDIRNNNKLEEILAKFKPSNIYHLAAQSYPTVSWKYPKKTLDINAGGTINLLEIVKKLGLHRVLVAGSSAQYGEVHANEVPVYESHAMRPLHPYGVSKVAQELLAYQYYKNDGIDCFTMRIFNTTGPRKVNDVCSDFTRQVAAIELGMQKPVIKVGNLDTQRAITDVRDVIRGFYLAMKHAEPGKAYNISGSEVYKIRSILNCALFFGTKNPEVIQDPKLMRSTDEPIIFGNSKKFSKLTCWEQKIPIRTTIKDMIEYWTSHSEKIKDSTRAL